MNQDESSADIFTCSLGNLPPRASAQIELSYVTTIPVEATDGGADQLNTHHLRFSLPLSIYPRYTPGNTALAGQTRAPQAPAAGVDPVTSLMQLTVRVHKDVMTGDRISPTHTFQSRDEDSYRVLQVNAQSGEADFVLHIPLASAEELTMYAAVSEGPVAPTTLLLSYSPAVLAREFDNEPITEVIFVVDCSGSMRNDRIKQASRALISCLSGLPVGTLFNIVRFGSHFVSLYPTSRAMGDAEKDESSRYARQLAADLGGTELLNPLQSIASAPPSNYPRHVFVLTDGAVSNSDQVSEFVRQDHLTNGTT